MTLVKLLNQRTPFGEGISQTSDENLNVIKRNAVYKCLAIIYSDEELPRVKAALHVLEIFLSKNVTSLPLMIDMLYFPQELVEDTSINLERFLNLDLITLGQGKSFLRAFVSKVVNQILLWMKYPDIGPAAGHLLIAIFKSLLHQGSRDESAYIEVLYLPQWAEPIRQSLKDQPDLIEVIGHHVLPGLLSLNMNDTASFFNSLPFADLQRGRMSSLKEEDIGLCLLVMQVVETSGLSESLSMLSRMRLCQTKLTIK